MKKFPNFLIIGITTILSLTACEIFLRLIHYDIAHYWRDFEHVLDEPTTNQDDPVLGWRPKEGQYVFNPFVPGEKGFTLTIWPRGARATAPAQKRQNRSVVALGCSLTQGWAISDDETMFWKLQERHPDIEFVNLGVAGYSTYQSLLSLEEYLKTSAHLPKVVLYGLIGHHALRNVGDINWLLILSHMSRRGYVSLPYCLTDRNNQLQFFPPESYPSWWGDHTFLIVNLVKSAYLKWEFRARRHHAKSVMEQLLLRLDSLCKSKGIKFYTVLLQLQNEREQKYYERFLANAGIPTINCDDPRSKLPEMTVKGEGHPNGAMNTIWSRCIEEGIKQDLAD